MGTADNWPLPALHHLSDDTVLSTNMNYYSIYQQLEFKLAAAHSADSAARTERPSQLPSQLQITPPPPPSVPKPATPIPIRVGFTDSDLCGLFCVKR